MQEIELDGEIYYENKGKYYNSSFLEVESETKNLLVRMVLWSVDYKSMGQNELVKFIYKIKETEEFNLCIDICLFGLGKFGNDEFFVAKILPIVTSTYRNLNKPENAINIAKEQRKKFKCESVALYTSIAAAYCDIGEFETALKFANAGYALQGGGMGYKNELSLVYKRIEKGLKEKDKI